jgi:para-aminobenzoate synthetase component 1
MSPADVIAAEHLLTFDEPSAADPFDELEAFLAENGFAVRAGADRARAPRDVVADVYLGYGLAVTLPGVREAQPAEPCPLPLLAAHIRPATADDGQRRARTFRVGRFSPTWSADDHRAAVSAAREAIGRGDVYQINLVNHMRAPFSGDPRAVAAALRPLRGRYGAALYGDGWSIVSATPELFVDRVGDTVRTMPIKGTRPADSTERIAESPKDLAEHVMIVDLERNDLSRVCVPGTVHVPSLAAEEPMAGVRHMVSTVQGTIAPGHGLADLLRATFPGGSVTGAPKVSAIDHIARLEPVGRGASMGALGTIQPDGDLELGLTIRTFAIAEGEIHLWVGGGIVWDSEPHAEHEESLVKARPLLAHLGATIG